MMRVREWVGLAVMGAGFIWMTVFFAIPELTVDPDVTLVVGAIGGCLVSLGVFLWVEKDGKAE